MKFYLTSAIGTLIAFLGIFTFWSAERPQSDVYDRKQVDVPAEVMVYETEAEGPEDCASTETYDEERGVCSFECTSEEMCTKMQEQADAELEELGDEYTDSGVAFAEPEDGEESEPIATYTVNPDETITPASGNPAKEYQSIWRQFAAISPDSFTKQYVESFEITDNSDDDTLAYTHDDDGNGRWSVGVNVGSFGKEGKREDVLTLVHEFAHIVTLNTSQVTHSSSTCRTYDTGDGCAHEGSYINSFVSLFWNQTDRAAATAQTDLYAKKPQSFVTEYASSSPEEDIAESFALFVLNQKPENPTTIKDKKVAFFYQHPALVSMRDSVRKGLGSILLARKHATH